MPGTTPRSLNRRLIAALVAALPVLGAVRPAHAQDRVAVSDSTAFSCEGLRVDSIEVRAERPPFKGQAAIWRRMAHGVGLHHKTTNASLVRRFVTLSVGEPCTEFRRTESERILREQPYLSDAEVRAEPNDRGGVTIVVRTVDEVPALATGRIGQGTIQALTLGNENVWGRGVHFELRGAQGGERRFGAGGRFLYTQMFGHPYTLDVDAQRDPLGGFARTELSHPFLTNLQRIAWHTGFVDRLDYEELREGMDVRHSLPVRRTRWDVGGVLRVGGRERLWLLGGFVSGERTAPGARLFTLGDHDALLLDADSLGASYPTFRTSRVGTALGLRALTYHTVLGFDALGAEQDIATGVQVGVLAGASPRMIAADMRDLWTSADIYAGLGSRWSFIAVRAQGEIREGRDPQRWEHLIAGGRAAWYLRPAERWLSTISVDGAGAFRERVPIQLELGEWNGGVRGYRASRQVGGRRLVARVEQRMTLGTARNKALVAVAAFADAGRLWAGDAPFGTDTPLRTSAGVALLVAVPPHSKRVARVDFALPTTRADGAKLEVRFSLTDRTRNFWEQPDRLARVRTGAVPAGIFSWP
ncbi:MAG: hypothetical protein JWO05_2579 [Gemmatimonadetes bacterium]|nr:hypothetical protein [Gemmatimonadota bacterium]